MPIYRPNNSTPFLVQSPYGQKQAGDITGQTARPGQFGGGSTAEGGSETQAVEAANIAARDPSLDVSRQIESYDPRTGKSAVRETQLKQDRGTVDVKSPFGGAGFARKDLGQSTSNWGGLTQAAGGDVTSSGANITQRAPTVLNYVMANRGKELGRAESLGMLSRSGITGEEGLDRALEERKFGFTGEEQSADYDKWRKDTGSRLTADTEQARSVVAGAADASYKKDLIAKKDLLGAQVQAEETVANELKDALAQIQAYYNPDARRDVNAYGRGDYYTLDRIQGISDAEASRFSALPGLRTALATLKKYGYSNPRTLLTGPDGVRLQKQINTATERAYNLRREYDPLEAQFISLYGE